MRKWFSVCLLLFAMAVSITASSSIQVMEMTNLYYDDEMSCETYKDDNCVSFCLGVTPPQTFDQTSPCYPGVPNQIIAYCYCKAIGVER